MWHSYDYCGAHYIDKPVSTSKCCSFLQEPIQSTVFCKSLVDVVFLMQLDTHMAIMEQMLVINPNYSIFFKGAFHQWHFVRILQKKFIYVSWHPYGYFCSNVISQPFIPPNDQSITINLITDSQSIKPQSNTTQWYFVSEPSNILQAVKFFRSGFLCQTWYSYDYHGVVFIIRPYLFIY